MYSSNPPRRVKRLLILVENIELLALALESYILLALWLRFRRNLGGLKDLCYLSCGLLGRHLRDSIVTYAKNIVGSVSIASP